MESIPKASPDTIVIEYPRRPSISFSHTAFPYSLYFLEPTTAKYFSVWGNSPTIRIDCGGSFISRRSGGKSFLCKSLISISCIVYRIFATLYMMVDIKFIRENKDLVSLGAKKKHTEFDVDALLKVDDKRKELLLSIEKKRAEQNGVSEKMVQTEVEAEKSQMIAEMKVLKQELQKEEEELKKVMHDWQVLMIAVPNIPDVSVPEGVDDKDNKEVKVWGDIPKFDFKPKDHIELMQNLGMIDLERGVKVSGFRGYFLKNDGALLSYAIWQHAMNHFMKQKFVPMLVPSLVRREAFIGTGYLPQGEDDLYKTQDGEFLAGTAEVATMAY